MFQYLLISFIQALSDIGLSLFQYNLYDIKRLMHCFVFRFQILFRILLYVLGVRGIQPSQMAVMFFNAIEDFVAADRPKHLKSVCVVIYERKMVDEFTRAIAKETGTDAG